VGESVPLACMFRSLIRYVTWYVFDLSSLIPLELWKFNFDRRSRRLPPIATQSTKAYRTPRKTQGWLQHSPVSQANSPSMQLHEIRPSKGMVCTGCEGRRAYSGTQGRQCGSATLGAAHWRPTGRPDSSGVGPPWHLALLSLTRGVSPGVSRL